MTSAKRTYFFSDKRTEGNGEMRNLLGGKGANLAEMCLLGIPVPPGFTITTGECIEFYSNNQQLNDELKHNVSHDIAALEQALGKKFGDASNPLLVSVRSGSRSSMPGMMDTILNLGLNDQTVQGLVEKTQNPRFAYDSYRRFIQMYSSVVLEISHEEFEDALHMVKRKDGIVNDSDLNEAQLQALIVDYKKIITESGKSFPQDVYEQLWGAISAVFKSWHNTRAKKYRALNSIPDAWGTAVNIQSMVFGNMGDTSATGVCFTRNPSAGTKLLFGEYLVNAQGEDVVAGIRTPSQITNEGKLKNHSKDLSLEECMPACFKELLAHCQKLETHYKDMQDIEFTIEDGKLWILQTRNGKRSASAMVKIAHDMANEQLITRDDALLKLNPESLEHLLHPSIDKSHAVKPMTKGLPASPGAASGKIVFDSQAAEELSKTKKVILVRNETSPEDIGGMSMAEGILTAKGGMTSHAAVVARGMGKPCVSGAGEMEIDYKSRTMMVGKLTLREEDEITIDGATGEVYLGVLPTITSEFSQEFKEMLLWANAQKALGVRANADTPTDAATAKKFGAEGIGLCRTEHMFFKPERIMNIRRMIVAETTAERIEALDDLLNYQKQDFDDIFKTMGELPVTVRLLDPPLHEFLPTADIDIESLAIFLDKPVAVVRARVNSLHETNPMLGHRGCRLAITYPEIYAMQAKAIFLAIAESKLQSNIEIMVPLVMELKEFIFVKNIIINEAKAVEKQFGIFLQYQIGSMIELPRAALIAGEIALESEFFSFGTNDLTQTTLGISRDDSSKFIPDYTAIQLLGKDPFLVIDRAGVGKLVEMACSSAKKARANIKLGICGEHGGNPESIEFFQETGLDYVSCSPFRIPIARIAAAQCVIRARKKLERRQLTAA